jgi:hypothetical protein
MEYAVRALRDKGACLQAKESLALAGQALFSAIIPLLDNAIVVIVVNQAEVRFVRNPIFYERICEGMVPLALIIRSKWTHCSFPSLVARLS